MSKPQLGHYSSGMLLCAANTVIDMNAGEGLNFITGGMGETYKRQSGPLGRLDGGWIYGLTVSPAMGRLCGGKRRLKDLLLQSDNRVCADCGAPDPKWASANIGVFICLKCCGVHRSLGTHISKVLSVTLDEWTDDEIDAMVEVGGNASANSIYEAFIPEGYSKPSADSGHEERAKFIRSKYELQDFLKPSLRISSIPHKKSSLQSSLSRKIMDSFRSSSSSQNVEGMVEFIGMLKVKVLKGTNLAIRDMLSSDPYVVLTLGHQKVQTTVVKSNLNPVWNEELMLSVPQDFGAVKLEVYDHDTFSADDIMGEAEVDIQPMITSAMAFGDAGMFGNMQIGKWLKSNDNALIEDSTVNIIDGKVKQEVSLKLQNVESGEISLDIEWIPLDQ
ncbi:hypothetical protein RHMOL_Rhmol13G0156000 [Rhododendron molle]|uniref:Uncharacterized protein n=1 Tax=Rhododendron molle TaxID=49168 RepID=A0ACC0L809_RHOML|nr:hypothetical protein RHMOL_Rhmol13G0156000 [Rhododendron molle]